MPLTLIQNLYDCLVSESYMAKMYAQLADKAPDEPTQQLLQKFASDELDHFEILRTLYEGNSGKLFVSPTPSAINIPDFNTALLDCIMYEIAAIDNYKALSLKMQASDPRNVFPELLQCETRHGYALLVLIAPGDTSSSM